MNQVGVILEVRIIDVVLKKAPGNKMYLLLHYFVGHWAVDNLPFGDGGFWQLHIDFGDDPEVDFDVPAGQVEGKRKQGG